MLILLISDHESYGFSRSIWNQFELVSLKKLKLHEPLQLFEKLTRANEFQIEHYLN